MAIFSIRSYIVALYEYLFINPISLNQVEFYYV